MSAKCCERTSHSNLQYFLFSKRKFTYDFRKWLRKSSCRYNRRYVDSILPCIFRRACTACRDIRRAFCDKRNVSNLQKTARHQLNITKKKKQTAIDKCNGNVLKQQATRYPFSLQYFVRFILGDICFLKTCHGNELRILS